MKIVNINKLGPYTEIVFNNGLSTIIDNDDCETVCQRLSFQVTNTYIAYCEGGKFAYLHQFILGKKDGFVIDHINRNKMDNRKQNLRYCSTRQNICNQKIHKNNTSGFPGVSWRPTKNKWRAFIMVNRKQINLGHFDAKEDAIKARKLGELKFFGEFAPNQQ